MTPRSSRCSISREQLGAVDDDAVADEAELIGIEDAGGDQMELELAEFVDDGMAGVISRGVTGYDMRFLLPGGLRSGPCPRPPTGRPQPLSPA